MKYCDSIYKIGVFPLVVLILLAGCTTPQPSPPTTTQSPPTGIPFSATSSPTRTAAPTQTPTPTKTITPTRTPWPTNTPKPTPTVTWTPLPTLPPDKALARVLELLKTNGGCKLPCWWGITPGVTPWDEAQAFLVSFATKIIGGPFPGYGILFAVPPSTIPGLIIGDLYNVRINVDNGIVDQIGAWKTYPVASFLTDYGPPSQVWIYGLSSNTISSYASYSVALFYPDQGIMAVWDGTTEKHDPIRVCPNRFDRCAGLWLWSPFTKKIFQEVADPLLDGPPPLAYYPIEKATNIDVKTFYQRYKDFRNSSICFEMPDPLLHPPD